MWRNLFHKFRFKISFSLLSLLILLIVFQNCSGQFEKKDFLGSGINSSEQSENSPSGEQPRPQTEPDPAQPKIEDLSLPYEELNTLISTFEKTFSQNFNSHSNSSSYSLNMFEQDFETQETSIMWQTIDPQRVKFINENSEKFLRIEIPRNQAGTQTTGTQFQIDIPNTNEAVLNYSIRLPNSFAPDLKGGKVLGLVGGTSNPSKPHHGVTGGNGADGFNGFSVRTNWWRTSGEARFVSYIYHPESTRAPYGQEFFWQKADDSFINVEDLQGQWRNISIYVKMNTPGMKDGKVKIWVEGVKVLDVDMFFRYDNSFNIETFFFSLFSGGPQDDLSFASETDTHIDIDNIEIFQKF